MYPEEAAVVIGSEYVREYQGRRHLARQLDWHYIEEFASILRKLLHQET